MSVSKLFVFGAVVAVFGFAGLALPTRSQDAAKKDKQAEMQKEIDDAVKALEKLDPKEREEGKKLLEKLRNQAKNPPAAGAPAPPPVAIPKGLSADLFNILDSVNKRNAALLDVLDGRPPPPPPTAIVPGMLTNPRLGAATRPIDKTLEVQLSFPAHVGQVVISVEKDSPADKAKLKAHDILVDIGGRTVSSNPAKFQKELSEFKANIDLSITVVRGAKKISGKGLKLNPDVLAEPMAP